MVKIGFNLFKNSKCILTLINATYFQNYLTRGGAQSSSHQKSAVSAIFLHTKQQKTFQGTLGTQDLTSIGSKTSHGPSMDPTVPLKWTSKFLASFRLPFLQYTLFSPYTHVGTLFGSLWNSTKAKGTLLDLHGPPIGPS